MSGRREPSHLPSTQNLSLHKQGQGGDNVGVVVFIVKSGYSL